MSDTNELPTIAPLANVGLVSNAVRNLMGRNMQLPGIAVLYGYSGWGKTTALNYAQNYYDAYHVECKENWTRRGFMLALLKNMGIQDTGPVYHLVDLACAQLAESGKPLLIDEVDHALKRGYIELVRDIYEGSRCAMLLAGEEQLPHKLKKFERIHGRVMEWVPAQPASYKDAKHLVNLYCPGIEVKEDLLKVIHASAAGSVRRIAVNLDRVHKEAGTLGVKSMNKESWGDKPLYTGEAPKRTPR